MKRAAGLMRDEIEVTTKSDPHAMYHPRTGQFVRQKRDLFEFH